MNLSDERKRTILAEIVELTTPEEPPTEAFTITEFREAAGCSHAVAEGRLARAVADGLLERRRFRGSNGRNMWYFWQI